MRVRVAPAGASIALGLAFVTLARADGPSKRECVVASESGQDLRSSGHLIDARETFSVCMRLSCPRVVREDCGRRLAQIDEAMPTVVLAAKDRAGNDLLAVTVTVDDRPLAEHLGGTAVEIDPGEHRFTFHAQGAPLVEKSVVVREGEKNRAVDVVLEIEAPSPKHGPASPPPEPSFVSAPAAEGSTQRVAGAALAAGGAVAAVVGTVLAFTSKSLYDHALHSECGGVASACTPAGVADGRAAHGQAVGATASFIVAGALLAGGAAVFFSAPRGPHLVPSVGSRGASLSFEVPW